MDPFENRIATAFRSAFMVVAAAAASAAPTIGLAAGMPNNCVKTLNVLENMLDAEKIQFKNDHCGLLRAATADRGAMIKTIDADPDQCGLDAKLVSIIHTQYQQLGQQSEACKP